MKLENFLLKESTKINLEHVALFRDEVAEALDEFSATIHKAGFNIEEYSEEPNETEFGVVFTNKIFDVTVYIEIRPGSRGVNSESFDAKIQIHINDNYAVGKGKTLITTIADWSWTMIADEGSLIQKIKLTGPHILELAQTLTDWYFDVTAAYDKVPMFVEKRGAENLVRALAGDFKIPTKTGEVYK